METICAAKKSNGTQKKIAGAHDKPARVGQKGQTAARKRLPLEKQHELIVAHQESALKIAQSILRGWGMVLPREELESAVNMALCEAAHNYVPTPSATFATYLFYFVKGSLLQWLRFVKQGADDREGHASRKFLPLTHHTAESSKENEREELAVAAGHEETPEKDVCNQELRGKMLDSLARLSRVERDVVCLAVVLEHKVAAVARQLHYSRGHLFAVRQAALRKMQNDLADFREAA